MSKNSKAKRDKKKKVAKRTGPVLSQGLDTQQIEAELQDLFDPQKLTTPVEINADIAAFCRKVSANEPRFIAVTPEPWSRLGCCDLNVQKFMEHHGGEMLCGYRIWYHNPHYIEGERYAVWHKEGEYRDLTFNADGEPRILFVADTEDKQGALEANLPRLRWGKDTRTKQLIRFQYFAESRAPLESVTDQQRWETLPSYGQWLSGEGQDAGED